MAYPVVVLEKSKNCFAKVHLYGATVTSWVTGGEEQLFLSSSSKMDGTKAIRGGIPIVFPNFGPWSDGPQHGFARISWWKVVKSPSKTSNGDIEAVFEMSDNEQTRKMWDFNFLLTYTVTLEEKSLSTRLEIKNTGKIQFDFTTLLHTYIRVSEISKTTVSGFLNCVFTDKVSSTDDNVEENEDVKIDQNIDRVYKQAGNISGHKISTPERHVLIQKTNMPDTVLWNPWKEKAATMSDFDDDGHLNMVCVEAGYVANRKVLSGGDIFTCSQKITIL